MSNLPTLQNIKQVRGQRVFLRGALNVPVENGVITDDYRLRKLLPTIEWLRERGARIILAGHMSNSEDSLKSVAEYFKNHFELTFIKEYADTEGADYGAGAVAMDVVESMQDGEVVLFENLRKSPGEEANDPEFARQLADYADVYVNDAFPASHRGHASIVGVPKLLPPYAGLQFIKEHEALSEVLNPEHPFVFILGGAKFSTKLPLVEKFSQVADHVFACGALANAYLQAAGKPVGASRVPDEDYDLSAGLASDALEVPTDVVVQTAAGETEVKSAADVQTDDVIVDIGPETLERITSAVQAAKLVVWNGPLGWYEKGFSDATNKLAQALKEIDGKSILGGGDTAAVILDSMSPEDFSFVSTAGGAMITYLSEESLPGIRVLEVER